MSAFTQFNDFRRVEHRTYRLPEQMSLIWKIGAKHSRWSLYFWPHDRADVTVPWYAEWLVALDILDPHDPGLIAAAFVHDKLLNEGFDKRFAAAEFRRVLVARDWKNPVMRELAYWGVYFHTTRNTGHPP